MIKTELGLNTLPLKCCGRCAHGREFTTVEGLKRMILCKERSPSVVMIPATDPATGRQGLLQKCLWPTMAPESECDAFSPAGSNSEGHNA